MMKITNISKLVNKLHNKQKKKLLRELKVNSEKDVTLSYLHALLQSKQADLEAREIACYLIMLNRSEESDDVLLGLFDNGDENLTHMVMLALSTIRTDKAVRFMKDILEHSSDENMLSRAIYVLTGYYGDKSARIALVKFLNNKNQSSEIRAKAAESLVRIGDPSLVDTFVNHLNDSSKEIQFWSIRALGRFCNNLSIITRLETFINDVRIVNNDNSIGEEAEKAIESIIERERTFRG